MSSNPSAQDRASEEAARWFAALNSPSISAADLTDFHAWRRQPENDLAYRQVEALWGKSRTLSSDPSIVAALAEAKARAKAKAPGGARSARWSYAAGGAAVALGLSAVVLFASQGGFGQRYSTGVGEQRTIMLSDGTKVRLDTDSQIAIGYSARTREVTLSKGQAFFDVVHLAGRPFEVRIGDTVVRDLGTRFDVRRNDGHVQVTLIEGSVQVSSPSAAPWRLSPGQQITTGSASIGPKPVNTAVATSWTNGRLVFNDLPLAEAIEEVNRYSTHRVILAAPSVEAIRVTGTFDTGDIEGFVSAATRLYDLSAQHRADGSIVLSAPDAPKAA